MGTHDARAAQDEAQVRAFTEALLSDLEALETMLARGLIAEGPPTIGAEQEMFLVGRDYGPASVAPAVLARANEARFTTEVARFNLEANLTPRPLGGRCLAELHAELTELVTLARAAAEGEGADVLLAGILPTLEPGHLTLEHLSPGERYRALNDAIMEAHGGLMRAHIEGTDALTLEHPNVMPEACNTSFQLHLQVAPGEFARRYNLAQWITAPILACAVNSPLLLGRRLWHETRIALFQQTVDVRDASQTARGARLRVGFGERWARDSVLDLWREDATRFRVMLASHIDEDSRAMLSRGEIPSLRALRLHNGTVYRWNRPCYGVVDGVAHLRIEQRALPAGPTLVDEVANAALFYGLMVAGDRHWGDVATRASFDDARSNFLAAARYGIGAELAWFGGKRVTAIELLTNELVPLAREGLLAAGCDVEDVNRYLDVIAERVATRRTGAAWTLASFEALAPQRVSERARAIAAALHDAQERDVPLHGVALAGSVVTPTSERAKAHATPTVRHLMSVDVFTVRAEDAVRLAASVMEWRHVRHIPVVDDKGALVGMVSARALLGALVRARLEGVAVRDFMIEAPPVVSPDTTATEALRRMLDEGASGLAVVEAGRLVGMLTERDLLRYAAEALGVVRGEA